METERTTPARSQEQIVLPAIFFEEDALAKSSD
jgi:hypothetical protein